MLSRRSRPHRPEKRGADPDGESSRNRQRTVSTRGQKRKFYEADLDSADQCGTSKRRCGFIEDLEVRWGGDGAHGWAMVLFDTALLAQVTLRRLALQRDGESPSPSLASEPMPEPALAPDPCSALDVEDEPAAPVSESGPSFTSEPEPTPTPGPSFASEPEPTPAPGPSFASEPAPGPSFASEPEPAPTSGFGRAHGVLRQGTKRRFDHEDGPSEQSADQPAKRRCADEEKACPGLGEGQGGKGRRGTKRRAEEDERPTKRHATDQTSSYEGRRILWHIESLRAARRAPLRQETTRRPSQRQETARKVTCKTPGSGPGGPDGPKGGGAAGGARKRITQVGRRVLGGIVGAIDVFCGVW
jgi:hypothetical protein